jgi:hypothetical protein
MALRFLRYNDSDIIAAAAEVPVEKTSNYGWVTTEETGVAV